MNRAAPISEECGSTPDTTGPATIVQPGTDLWFIKTRNDVSGFVEVHQRTAASGYLSGIDLKTSLCPSDAGNGRFQIG